MNRSEIRQVLDARGIRLTKSLGQNFLHDRNQLARIAGAAELRADDRVLEVGPGLGPLTEFLLRGAGMVLAVEKDVRLAAFLRERFAGEGRFHLVQGDALDLARLEVGEGIEPPVVSAFRLHMMGHQAPVGGAVADPIDPRAPLAPWKLVSNLPYSVASPLMVDLAWLPQRPARMVVTLQWEVARRLAAGPRTSDYGALTLLMGLDYEVAGWFKVPAGCFFPVPAVDSACVTLTRRTTPCLEGSERRTFRRLVKAGFSQRRKMMLKLLKQHWPAERLELAFGRCAIPLTTRAEELDLEQFVGMARVLEGRL